MKLPENVEIVKVDGKELRGWIKIKVIGPIEKSKETVCIGKFSLDIREPILEQLASLMSGAFSLSGICLNGKLIETEDTVQSRGIISGEVLEMLSAGGGKV